MHNLNRNVQYRRNFGPEEKWRQSLHSVIPPCKQNEYKRKKKIHPMCKSPWEREYACKVTILHVLVFVFQILVFLKTYKLVV
jgi:hypothetical protein